MIPDKIINLSISNLYSHIQYKNLFYNGTFDLIIQSASSNGPCGYFDICKFGNEEAYIHRKTCNNYDINILWELNETPKIYINNNINSYNVIIKIYEY